MRKIVMPGKIRRNDIALARRIEKESAEACNRRIPKFPLTMSAIDAAKALKAEGWYSKGTTVYYIEYRVKRLRDKAERERT